MKITATPIEPRAAAVDLAYPEAEPAHLVLDVPIGRVNLQPGAGESLISGKITYNIAELKPGYSVKNRTVRIRQKYQVLIPTSKVTNEWDFLLGTARPYSLAVGLGASESELDLSGLPLQAFKVQSGAGDLKLIYDMPNPGRMTEMRVRSGAGRAVLKGLLNANPEYIKISGGVGQVMAEFTGDGLTASGRARIEGGVGEFVLVLDEDAPIRVTTSMGLGEVDADEDLIKQGKSYRTPAYDASDIHFDIDVSAGVGSIKIELG